MRPVSDFCSAELYDNKFVLFKGPNVWSFIIEAIIKNQYDQFKRIFNGIVITKKINYNSKHMI